MSEFVEVTRRGLGGRSKDSIGGVFIGFILVAVGVILLFWNEGRAVKRYKDLKEGSGAVISIDSASVDPAMEGRLVHITGETKTPTPLKDDLFGITTSAIRLTRNAEMFQWVEVVKTEEKTKVGGGVEQVKTYSYRTEWKDQLVDSSTFKVTTDYRNPTEMKYRSNSSTAQGVTVAAFKLPDFLVTRIGGAKPFLIEDLSTASEEVKRTAKLNQGGVYFGVNPNSPSVGDQRVTFQVVANGPISVVAQQKGDTFASYRTATGGQLDLLESGTVSAVDMFQMAQDRNKFLTWAIRIGGFILLGMAFSMILRPIAVLASILPFLGRLVETGTTLVAFLIAGILWTLTVAVAWIFYRPLLGIAILIVTVGLFILVIKRLRKPAALNPGSPPPLT